MGNKHFFLGSGENSCLVKILNIIFGLACFAVAVFWMIYNMKSLKSDNTLWITIIFLLGFGFYQIWSGLGRTTLFIDFDTDRIILKKNAILPPSGMMAGEIERVDIFPLSVIFFLKTGRKILLRFGTTFHESNEKILDEIVHFTELNNIPVKITDENL